MMMQNLRSKLWIPAAVLAVLLLIDPLGVRKLPLLYVLFWLATLALAAYALLPLWQKHEKPEAQEPAATYALLFLVVQAKLHSPEEGVYLPDQNGEIVLNMGDGSVIVFQQNAKGLFLRVLGDTEVNLQLLPNEYYAIRRKIGTKEQVCFQVAALPY